MSLKRRMMRCRLSRVGTIGKVFVAIIIDLRRRWLWWGFCLLRFEVVDLISLFVVAIPNDDFI